jgi:hypothetical protein
VGWGGGKVEFSDKQNFGGGKYSMKVTSGGPYEGARIDFATPTDLGVLSSNPNRFLVLRIIAPVADQPAPKTPDTSTPTDTTNQNVSLPSEFPPARLASLDTDAQARVFTVQNDQPAATPPDTTVPTSAVPRIHIVFLFDNGMKADMMRDVPAPATDPNWVHVSIPLAAIPIPQGTTDALKLKSMWVAGDAPSVFYLGGVDLLTDDTPITCSAGDDQSVSPGDQVSFEANADGGVANLTYQWDYDTKDQFVDQDEGRTVNHTYKKAGTYKVTLTVDDVDGIKKAAVSTVTVKVESQ